MECFLLLVDLLLWTKQESSSQNNSSFIFIALNPIWLRFNERDNCCVLHSNCCDKQNKLLIAWRTWLFYNFKQSINIKLWQLYREETALSSVLVSLVTSLDILHVVSRIETNPAILPSLAPALLILILELLKLLAWNAASLQTALGSVSTDQFWRKVRQVQLPRSRRGLGQAAQARRYLSTRTGRHLRQTPRRQMDWDPSYRCWNIQTVS